MRLALSRRRMQSVTDVMCGQHVCRRFGATSQRLLGMLAQLSHHPLGGASALAPRTAAATSATTAGLQGPASQHRRSQSHTRAPPLPLPALPSRCNRSGSRPRHNCGHGVLACSADAGAARRAAAAAAGRPTGGPSVQPEEQPWPRLHGEVRGAAWGSGRVAARWRQRRRPPQHTHLHSCAAALQPCSALATPHGIRSTACRPAGGLAAQRRQQRHVRSADAAPASVGSGWMDQPESQPPPAEAQVGGVGELVT